VANVCMGNTAADIRIFPLSTRCCHREYPAPDDCAFRLRVLFKNEFLQLHRTHENESYIFRWVRLLQERIFRLCARGKEATRTGDASEKSQDAGLVTQSTSEEPLERGAGCEARSGLGYEEGS